MVRSVFLRVLDVSVVVILNWPKDCDSDTEQMQRIS